MEKDYSLLRPFDLEAAKRGENICTDIGVEVEFIAAAGPSRLHAIRGIDGNIGSAYSNMMRMSPLAWVEGRPVYKGDVLYHKRIGGDKFVAEKVSANAMDEKAIYCDRGTWLSSCELTWQKPKTKRDGWVNIYSKNSPCWRYNTKKDADEAATDATGQISKDRIACVKFEYEE